MKRVFFAALAIFLAVLAWVIWRQARPVGDAAPPPQAAAQSGAAPSTGDAASASSTAPRAEVLAQAAAPPPLPAEMTMAPTLSGIYAELLQLAQSGDVRAMEELGVRLMRCTRQGLAGERNSIASLESGQVPPGEHAAAIEANRRRNIERARRTIADCEALSVAERNSGPAWLERAADLGYGEAQLSYVGAVLHEYQSYDSEQMVAEIDEVIRRRDLARRYVGEAITHCVPRALITQALYMSLLFDGDDARARAIAEAGAFDAVLRQAQAEGNPAQIAAQGEQFARASAGLDAAGLAEARRQGEAMYQTCAPLPQ